MVFVLADQNFIILCYLYLTGRPFWESGKFIGLAPRVDELNPGEEQINIKYVIQQCIKKLQQRTV